MTTDNPYLVTTTEPVATEADSSESRSTKRSIAGWAIVFLLNLPIPVFLGSSVVSGIGGYVGMAVGCCLWWGLGIRLCFGAQVRHVRATTVGGLLVALSQFYPMLQLFAGMFAIFIVNLVVVDMGGGPGRLAMQNPLADFAISTTLTLLTGAILIAVALTGGHLLLLLFRSVRDQR